MVQVSFNIDSRELWNIALLYVYMLHTVYSFRFSFRWTGMHWKGNIRLRIGSYDVISDLILIRRPDNIVYCV